MAGSNCTGLRIQLSQRRPRARELAFSTEKRPRGFSGQMPRSGDRWVFGLPASHSTEAFDLKGLTFGVFTPDITPILANQLNSRHGVDKTRNAKDAIRIFLIQTDTAWSALRLRFSFSVCGYPQVHADGPSPATAQLQHAHFETRKSLPILQWTWKTARSCTAGNWTSLLDLHRSVCTQTQPGLGSLP